MMKDLMMKDMENKRAAAHVAQGVNLSYEQVIPDVIERVTCGEYHYKKMMREMSYMNASDIQENM